jgi:predicted  nucleic acid-binding Zn-ribbon protein
MGAASSLENMIERLISDLSHRWDQLRDTPGDPAPSELWNFETRLKACEETYVTLMSKLQSAKELAANPELSKPLQMNSLRSENNWLHIQNGKSQKEIERLQREITRLKEQLPDNREDFRRELERQRKRAADTEQECRRLRVENKSQRAAIATFKSTHQVGTPQRGHKRKNRTFKRSTSKPVKQGDGLFALSVQETKGPKKRPKPRHK